MHHHTLRLLILMTVSPVSYIISSFSAHPPYLIMIFIDMHISGSDLTQPIALGGTWNNLKGVLCEELIGHDICKVKERHLF